MLDRHERAGTYDDPEYEEAMEAYFDRHFYRGPKPRAELERDGGTGGAPDVYRAMQGPNEWTTTGALKGWDTRDRLREIDVPTLVIRGPVRHVHRRRSRPSSSTASKGAREVVLEESSHTPVLEETRPLPRCRR